MPIPRPPALRISKKEADVAEITPVLTRNIGDGPPLDLRGYRDAAGYEGLKKAMQN